MKWLKLLALPALLALGFYILDSRAEKRGRELANAEALVRKEEVRKIVDDLSAELQTMSDKKDAELASRLSEIRAVETTVIRPTLIKEIRSETRFTDPSAGITDGMFDALNDARRLTHPSASVSGEPRPLSPAESLEGQEP